MDERKTIREGNRGKRLGNKKKKNMVVVDVWMISGWT